MPSLSLILCLFLCLHRFTSSLIFAIKILSFIHLVKFALCSYLTCKYSWYMRKQLTLLKNFFIYFQLFLVLIFLFFAFCFAWGLTHFPWMKYIRVEFSFRIQQIEIVVGKLCRQPWEMKCKFMLGNLFDFNFHLHLHLHLHLNFPFPRSSNGVGQNIYNLIKVQMPKVMASKV